MPSVKQETKLARIESGSTIHDPVIEATSHDEAMAEIKRRIAKGHADSRSGFLIVPPTDDCIEAWEARQANREKGS